MCRNVKRYRLMARKPRTARPVSSGGVAPEGTWKGKACRGEAIFFTQGDAAARAQASGLAAA